MKKMLAVSLCVCCALCFSGYDWGKKESPQKTRSYSSPVASSSMRMPSSSMSTSMAAATKLLGNGTPEEKKARMESIKRLGQALAKKNSNAKP